MSKSSGSGKSPKSKTASASSKKASAKPKAKTPSRPEPTGPYAQIDSGFDDILDQLDPSHDQAAMGIIDALRLIAYQLEDLSVQVEKIYQDTQEIENVKDFAESSRDTLRDVVDLLKPKQPARRKPSVF